MKLVGVYGASGYGREVMPLVRAGLLGARIVFIDDAAAPGEANGHEIMDWDTFVNTDVAIREVCIAIADSTVRQHLAHRCDEHGIALFEVRAMNVVQLDNVMLADGACLSPFVTLTSNIQIGRCFHANIYSYVGHDCIIGDFVTFAPAVKCNGNIVIEDHAYIGTGAILKQGKPGQPLVIGRGAIIGMGAVVTRDVPPGVTVIGNPARPLVKKD